jgi:hypothetical protein
MKFGSVTRSAAPIAAATGFMYEFSATNHRRARSQ